MIVDMLASVLSREIGGRALTESRVDSRSKIPETRAAEERRGRGG